LSGLKGPASNGKRGGEEKREVKGRDRGKGEREWTTHIFSLNLHCVTTYPKTMDR